jgi:hypothetical protein
VLSVLVLALLAVVLSICVHDADRQDALAAWGACRGCADPLRSLTPVAG